MDKKIVFAHAARRFTFAVVAALATPLSMPLLADDGDVAFRVTDVAPIDNGVQASFADDVPVESFAITDSRPAEETPSKRTGRYCLPGHLRAGLPFCYTRWARPAVCADYEVGYIGGGSIFFGENRCRHEGTFGLDYTGLLLQRKTWLQWTHGGRYQGGEGAYKTDGPKILE